MQTTRGTSITDSPTPIHSTGIPVEPPTLRKGFTTPKDQSYKNILLFSEFYDLDRNWYLGTNLIADNVSP